MKLTAKRWNRKGTRVKYFPYYGSDYYKETTTRSKAWELAHGEPVVQIIGNIGAVCLERLEAIENNGEL